MKKILATLSAFVLTLTIFAQAPPSIYLLGGTNLCDATPYKLVFSDDFDGSSIDPNKWHTYFPCRTGSWCGGDGSDSWEGARYQDPSWGVIFKDANVIVGGGICTLKVNQEPTSWYGKSTNFSSGALVSRYTKYYNSGIFEAHMKMPVFYYAHSTFWLYRGPDAPGKTRANEIDIAEAYGNPYWPTKFPGDNNRFCNYSLHYWKPSHVEDRNHYPNQRWIDMIKSNYFKQDDWHTYTFEWDKNVIKIYIDGVWIGTKFKYFQWMDIVFGTPGSWGYHVMKTMRAITCTVPSTGYYETMPGFPYKEDDDCTIQFTPGIDHQGWGIANGGVPFEKGSMQIDYVRVWQRHPEQDNNTDLCGQLPILTGPKIICSTANFTLSNPIPGGTFSVNNNLVIVSNTASSVTVQRNPSAIEDWGEIIYTYSIPGCQTRTIVKKVDLGKPRDGSVTVVKLIIPFVPMTSYAFNAAKNPYPRTFFGAHHFESPTTFEWDIDYGPGMATHYHAFGQTIMTPFITNSNSGVSWILKISNACGTTIKSGTKTSFGKTTNQDSTVDYFNAIITDSTQYMQAISERVAQEFVEDPTDSTAINEMISTISFEELAPYIVFDSSFVFGDTSGNNGKMAHTNNIVAKAKIYPNPTYQNISIELGTDFSDTAPVQIRIIDLYGRVLSTQTTTGKKFSVDLVQLPQSMYILEINQNNVRERHRIHKM